MQWWQAIGFPIAAILGGLIGAWWQKRATRQAGNSELLDGQLQAHWSKHPGQRRAARETIEKLMQGGKLNDEQLLAASIWLRISGAERWELAGGQRSSIEDRHREQDGE